VLRLCEAKRSASALNASVYLRRLSGVVLLFFVLLIQEVYVLLLCALVRLPHTMVEVLLHTKGEVLLKVAKAN
jgi:hypothetical protein